MSADMLYVKPNDWKRDGRLHAAAWLIVAILAPTADLTIDGLAGWKLSRFLLTMALVAILHELCHVGMAWVHGWKSRFLFGRKTYWQPAVAYDPPGPLYARSYASIALAPIGPSIMLAWFLYGPMASGVALILSGGDLMLLWREWRREQAVRPFMEAMPGRDVASLSASMH